MSEKSDERVAIQDPTGESLNVPAILPVLPVRDVIVFPGVTVPLTIGRRRSVAALEEAGANGYLLVLTQHEPTTEEPGLGDVYEVGTVVRVMRVVDARREGKQALVVGIARARVDRVITEEPAMQVRFESLSDTPASSHDEAIWRRVVGLAQRVVDLRDDYPDEWKSFIAGIPTPGMLADLLASNLTLPIEDNIKLLRENQPGERLRVIEMHLKREVTIAETQRTLRDEAESGGMDKKRRERMLRSRMREIQEEIGEGDAGLREVDELREKLEAAELPEEAYDQADREMRRLSALPQHAPDRHLIRTYLEWMVELPWNVETPDDLDLGQAREILDADHHGLDRVKDRILEFLAVRKLAPETKAPILCFVGPPGVGKTSLGKSIARCMGRKFTRASLGGVRDEAEVRGHRRTYVGAMPGRVIQGLKRAGARNPVFLLDEIDKLGSDFRGDPSSALLEVLDPEQNDKFSDHYIETPFDLSRVLFIATANTLQTIPPALLDRMEVIELSGYTEAEKLVIARRYLVPRQLEAHGLDAERVAVDDAALEKIVSEYTREAGVRNLERFVATLMRKCARRVAEEGGKAHIHVDEAFTSEALGAPPHLPESAERTSIPGVAVGLAVTAHGGDILFIEATSMPGGKGIRLRLTGQLGDVMRESAEAALSWVRAHAKELGLTEDMLRPGEIHMHVPAGAVPKDGPSAGVALVTAIVSVLSNRRARPFVAMTGEISLRGRVLPVGGIKGKLFAASRAGIETVVMPRRNEKDLTEVPDDVKSALNIQLVDTISEALDLTLADEPALAS
ncbi:MAG: endopeptidase La [Deltaproteobacteria bacterium]|nr:endopeptidase La [Deltaproteobacteria bacterium]